MGRQISYPVIDPERTGKRLKKLLGELGLGAREVQEYLHLSCPQPVYRWFKGKTMPSLDHLYALSILLGRHMEELVVSGGGEEGVILFGKNRRRMLSYWEKIEAAA